MGFKTIISLTVFQSLFLLFVTFNTLGNIFDGQEAVISSFTNNLFERVVFKKKIAQEDKLTDHAFSCQLSIVSLIDNSYCNLSCL